MFIDANTPRATLEQIAVQDCGIGLDMVAPMSDEGLLSLIQEWIEDGDECAGAA